MTTNLRRDEHYQGLGGSIYLLRGNEKIAADHGSGGSHSIDLCRDGEIVFSENVQVRMDNEIENVKKEIMRRVSGIYVDSVYHQNQVTQQMQKHMSGCIGDVFGGDDNHGFI